MYRDGSRAPPSAGTIVVSAEGGRTGTTWWVLTDPTGCTGAQAGAQLVRSHPAESGHCVVRPDLLDAAPPTLSATDRVLAPWASTITEVDDTVWDLGYRYG